MIDRGDGIYIYKDKTKLTYGQTMSQIDCLTLDEKINVEKYIRDNISTISKEKAVLGGTWSVFDIFLNPSLHTANVIYEDGHIQKTGVFTYSYNKETRKVDVVMK